MRVIVAWDDLKKILEGNGSLVNIIFGTTFNKMEVDIELTPMSSPLYGFTSDNIIPRRKITLSVEREMAPLVDNHSTYPGVLERPALEDLWVITSFHHFCVNFPSEKRHHHC